MEQTLQETVFDAGPVAQVVLDAQGRLSMANARAREQFGLIPLDIGKPFQDLELSYRPAELRSSIEHAYQRKGPITLEEVRVLRADGQIKYYTVVLTPVYNEGPLGISISFYDVSDHKDLQDQLKEANQELETAMEELQSTNEELETTNEELQSTIEELETTNEELQSTNEELETMNEELQSTNEELETTNDEMTIRTEELNKANSFLESLFNGMQGSVIVIDPELVIQIWNRRSVDMWGLRDEETIGHNLLNLDFGLPVDEFIKPLREVLEGRVTSLDTEVKAINRRGRLVRCRVTCNPLFDGRNEIQGAILVAEQIKEQHGEST
jgi:two-component system CheB/CheR fusion protein